MPTPFSVNDTIKKAEQEYGFGKGEYFKVQEGSNKIRVLSPFVGYESEFKGNKNFKFVCWVLDRKDNVIKPYFMPVSIANMIGDLQLSDEYSFSEVPMPYDITIKATNAGTKEVTYTVIPSPTRIDITSEEHAEFSKKMSIDEFVEKLKEKAGGNAPQLSESQKQKNRAEIDQAIEDEVKVENIPF